MSDAINIQRSIMEAVETIATRRIEQLELDKTIIGIINSDGFVTADGKKVYRIKYEGGFFYAISRNANDAYLINTAVYIQVPKGDFSRDKFILGKVNNMASNAQKSVVSAIANNYGIVGKNIVKHLDIDNFGVHSYHSIQEEETRNPESIYHRYNLLYQYDREDNPISVLDGDLKAYKQDATAIMIRADFMTKLSSEQKRQASGEYGLIFSLAFKNLAADTDKNTYKEIFDSFAQDIKANVQSPNTEEQYYEVTLQNEDSKIFNLLHSDADENLSQIDYILNEILELQRVYIDNNPADYSVLMETYTNSYINMIQDLARMDNLRDALTVYEDWMNTEPAIPREKIVSYYVSSNNMVGNPFILTSWTTQYEVFAIDLENLLRIDSIYLYQNGFIQNEDKEKNYLNGEPDILVKNLQFYVMKPLTDYNSTYQLKVETPETGAIFTVESDEKSTLTIEATVIREYFENLTRSSRTSFYWFKQDKNVVTPQQAEYNVYAGPGWKEIDNNHYNILNVTKKENPANENFYRCVAVYSGEETPIVLRYDFIIYNESGQKFVLTSDQLNDFSFDSGNPTLTIYKEVNGELVELNSDSDYQQYQMVWTLIDGNGQATVLQLPQQSTEQYVATMPVSRVLKNIQFFKQDVELNTKIDDLGEATRIKYPMSNVASSSSVTFEVRIGYRANKDSDSFPSIGMATITLNNHKITNLSSYRLVIENGDQIFQYDEYGNAPNSNKIKDPQEILPLKARIFAPNNLEVAEQNFRTKWFFPTGESMISQGNNIWKYNPATGDTNMYEGQITDFTISNLFNYNAFDNQIICQVTFTDLSNKEDQIFTQTTTFNFVKVGDNGTNGTDMVAKIEPKINNSLYIQQPPTIITYKENDIQKAFINSSEYHFSDFSKLTDKEDGLLTVKLYQKTEEVNLENAQIRWNVAGNTSTATNKKGKYFEIEDYNLIWNSEQDGYRQQIIKAEVNYEHKSYYAFYSMPIIEYVNKPSVLTKNRIGIDIKTYLKDVLYNSDGRNPLYSHNQGLKLLNLPEHYYIEWEACGGYTEQENTPCIHLLLEKDAKQHSNNYCSVAQNYAIEIVSNLNLNKEDEEKISLDDWLQENNINSFSDMIYILPDDEYAGNITNNYIKASVYNCDIDFNKELIATIYAPINMTLNTFGLASLNAWDGNSIMTDEEEGYIMAPQIGAGYKDEFTNLFTGVVMGQADDYSSGQEHLYTGLMGYKDGMRSFFLDSETGNATFGYPTLENNSGKIRTYDKEKKKWVDDPNKLGDDYNEGVIKLIPGGESVIGGWRLGRRSLYYTAEREKKDGVYKYSGKIGEKNQDPWAEHHERDIRVEDQGILISANPAYISIKGKKILDDSINNDENSQIKSGDSVEIQLDPENTAALAIFRHYQLNGVWKREQLSGLNNKGQLVANQMIQIPAEDEESAGETAKTALGVERITAFNNNSYIGLNLGLSKNSAFDDSVEPFFRVFMDSEAIGKEDQVYITGGLNEFNSDYGRPFSMHGKSITLYADSGSSDSDSSKSPTTKHLIKISDGQFLLQTSDINKIDFNDSSDNYIYTKNNLNINTIQGSNQKFNLTTGEQTIKAVDSLITVTSKGYTLNSSNTIDINTTNGNDINIKRKKDNNESSISIGIDKIEMKINDNNLFKINTASDKTSDWKSTYSMNLLSQNRIIINAAGDNASLGGTSEDNNALVLKAGPNSKLMMQSKSNNFAGSTAGYPFYLDFGASIGHCLVEFNNGTGQAQWYTGMSQQISDGLEILGSYLSNADSYGLKVTNNVSVGGKIDSTGAITTSTGFYGNGTNISNTASGNSTEGSGANVSGLGSSGTGSFAAVSMSNGRPSFSTRTMSVSIPSASDIYDAIEGWIGDKISDALSSALKSYAKKSDLDNYVKTGKRIYLDCISGDQQLVNGSSSTGISYVSGVSGGKDSPAQASYSDFTVQQVSSSINSSQFYIET